MFCHIVKFPSTFPFEEMSSTVARNAEIHVIVLLFYLIEILENGSHIVCFPFEKKKNFFLRKCHPLWSVLMRLVLRLVLR